MLTKADISKFYKDLESLQLRFPIAELARVTGYSKGNVSDYINRKKEPSENFISSFYKGYKSSLNVPRELEVREDSPKYNAPVKEKVHAHDALLSVLVAEFAQLKASVSGEHPEVITKRIYKAAQDVASLSDGG